MAARVLPEIISEPKKKTILTHRQGPDRSQRIRHIVQWSFVALNIWLGAQFYIWVRYFKHGGQGLYLPRPAGVEGWLPIDGLMNVRYLLLTGRVPAIHPAAMYLLLGFLLMSLLLKKAFCSWLCPLGTLSENLWKLGQRIFGRNFRLPKWFDIPLRSLKYILLGLFIYLIWSMSADSLGGFIDSPYGMIVDVKMMNFFLGMSLTGGIVFATLIVLSILVQNFWCRYLCPYGALMGLASLLSPVAIRRDSSACIDCSKCSRACPAHLPVDKLVQIRSAECNACMACIAECPSQTALQIALPGSTGLGAKAHRRRLNVSPLAMAALLAYIFFGTVMIARATNHWQTNLPRSVYMRLVPNADSINDTGMQ